MTTSNPSKHEQSTGVLQEVSEAVKLADLVLILAVPFLLLAVFLLPHQIQTELYLDYGNPSLLTLWSAAYVHWDASHLANNLLAYCIIVSLSYLLLAFVQKQRLFRYVLIAFLVLVPPLIGLVNIVLIGRGIGAGFSGIGSALFGFLPLTIFVSVRYRFSSQIEVSYSVSLFLIVAGIIAIIYNQILFGGAILFLSGVLVTVYASRIGLSELKSVGSKIMSDPSYLPLVVIATLFYLTSPLLLFPEEIVRDGNAVNILSHYVGLVVGYFGPATIMIWR